MKKLTAIFVVLFAVAFSSNVFAQNTDQATSTASAKVVSAISIENNRGLLFGDIAYTLGEAGTITIAAQDELDINYSVEDMELSTATRQSAKFTITGEADYLFSIVLPATVTLNSASDEMTIATSMNLSETGNELTGGSVELYVGGTLSVDAAQATEQYNGSFNVTVSYE